jgi:hypothetical protein
MQIAEGELAAVHLDVPRDAHMPYNQLPGLVYYSTKGSALIIE